MTGIGICLFNVSCAGTPPDAPSWANDMITEMTSGMHQTLYNANQLRASKSNNK